MLIDMTGVAELRAIKADTRALVLQRRSATIVINCEVMLHAIISGIARLGSST